MQLNSREKKIVFCLTVLSGPLWILLAQFHSGSFGFRWGNGDHFYYVAHSQLFRGVEYREALQYATERFSYARPSIHLDYEWLDTAISPLLYARTLLPMSLAVATSLFGAVGVYIPSLVFGTITSILWYRILCTSSSRALAITCSLAIAMSPSLVSYRFGLYTESPLLLALSTAVYVMLHARWSGKFQVHHGTCLLSLIVLVALIRQSSLVLILPLIAWSIGLVGREKKRRYAYLGVAVIFVGVVVNLMMGKWAPYDPIPYVMEQIGTTDRSVAVSRILTSAPDRFIRELIRMVRIGVGFDLSYLLLLLTLPLIMIFRRRSLMNWPCAFALAVSVLVTTTNYRPTSLRYMSAVVPFMIGALAQDNFVGGAVKEKTKWLRNRTLVILILMVGAVVWTVTDAHQPAKNLTWHSISPESVGIDWTVTFPKGEIACDPDELQIWIRDNRGQIYAASGSAMRHRFWVRSIDEASTIKRTTLVSPVASFMRLGLTYCNTTFMGE